MISPETRDLYEIWRGLAASVCSAAVQVELSLLQESSPGQWTMAGNLGKKIQITCRIVPDKCQGKASGAGISVLQALSAFLAAAADVTAYLLVQKLSKLGLCQIMRKSLESL